ncbi:MAG TPA: MYXO-CTERM sorting domain-containing protein [Polyangiaceae bacterium]|nr:MYXO-CTERM sorting domain-containing protein [Polyangiaceae bacterium]
MRGLIGAACFITTAMLAREAPADAPPATTEPAPLDPQLWSPGPVLRQTDVASANDQFGGAVAVSGETIVIGAPGHSLHGHIAEGAAYSFKRNGKQWIADGPPLTVAADYDYQRLSASIALTSDTLFLWAPKLVATGNDRVGAFLVYARADVGWTPFESPLIPMDPSPFQGFGTSIAISGDTLIVGADYKDVGVNQDQGAAYIFERNGSDWVQQGPPLVASNGAAGDHFGRAVAISNDTLIIGAEDKSPGLYAQQGAAYVFVRNGATWQEQAVLTDLDAPAGKHFGARVAIAGDTVAVGSHPNDYPNGQRVAAAIVFNRVGTSWLAQPPIHTVTIATGLPRYATSVALSEDASTLAIGTSETTDGRPDNGAGYIFARVAGSWQQQGPALHGSSTGFSNFGQAVAISGHTVVFGALGDTPPGGSVSQGAAYVYSDGPCAADTDCPSAGYCAAGVCRARCTGDADCGTGSYCSASARCQAQKLPGAVCSREAGNDCLGAGCHVCSTGNCVDGVCCESACSGTCVGCAAALTGEADGTCAAIPADRDPRGDCAEDLGYPTSCLADGSCDGHGDCRQFAKSGTACGETTCTVNTVSGAICDGAGQCIVNRMPCAPYACHGSACSAECATDADCDPASAYCAMSVCTLKKELGEPCTSDHQCREGLCTDGVCCESCTPDTGAAGAAGADNGAAGAENGNAGAGNAGHGAAGLGQGGHAGAGEAGDAGDVGDTPCADGTRRAGQCGSGRDPESVSCNCRTGAAPRTGRTAFIALALTALHLARRRRQRPIA